MKLNLCAVMTAIALLLCLSANGKSLQAAKPDNGNPTLRLKYKKGQKFETAQKFNFKLESLKVESNDADFQTMFPNGLKLNGNVEGAITSLMEVTEIDANGAATLKGSISGIVGKGSGELDGGMLAGNGKFELTDTEFSSSAQFLGQTQEYKEDITKNEGQVGAVLSQIKGEEVVTCVDPTGAIDLSEFKKKFREQMEGQNFPIDLEVVFKLADSFAKVSELPKDSVRVGSEWKNEIDLKEIRKAILDVVPEEARDSIKLPEVLVFKNKVVEITKEDKIGDIVKIQHSIDFGKYSMEDLWATLAAAIKAADDNAPKFKVSKNESKFEINCFSYFAADGGYFSKFEFGVNYDVDLKAEVEDNGESMEVTIKAKGAMNSGMENMQK